MNAYEVIVRRIALFAIVGSSIVWTRGGANVTLWDTNNGGRQNQTEVPSNLMALEKDPLKAASDPGYYGRAYTFVGEPVVENKSYTAEFVKDTGVLLLSSKTDHSVITIVPEGAKAVQQFEVIRNAGDEVVLAVTYAKGNAATFSFGRDEIVEIKTAGAKNVSFRFAPQYIVAPTFLTDDLIYSVADLANESAFVADNILVGLSDGEKSVVTFTWPGKQKVRLLKKEDKNGGAEIREIEIETGGQPVFVAALSAPAIWHKQKLDSSFLEKDASIDWKPPFPAKWQTQLSEGSVKTTFAFRDAKGTIWRGVPGMYNYPVWFEGGKANFSLSKKVPPRGEAIIYALEPQETPAGVLTPADVLKQTLGRPQSAKVIDVEGRALRTHHGACGSGVHRACTCGYTEAIQAVFEKKEETQKKEFVDQSVRDMIYFVETHLARIDEYRAFASSLTEYLHTVAKARPELKDYLDDLEQTVGQIPQEYDNQKENMKSLAFAGELYKATMALTGSNEPDNLKRYMDLLKAWRGMGGAQDYVVAQYHMLTRKLCQDAGYNIAMNPAGVEVAQEIRARCKAILRNPDGYEIWPNY